MKGIKKMLMNLRIASWQYLIDGVLGTEAVSTDPKCMSEGDAIYVQNILTENTKLLG